MIRRIIAILLISCIPCYAGPITTMHGMVVARKNVSSTTDYTQDVNCMGAWYMNNNGGNETDRSGEGTTLTQQSGTIPTSATVPTTPAYSGTSRDFEYAETEWLDANDGGATDISGANQSISICAWIKVEGQAQAKNGAIVTKYDANATNDQQYRLVVVETDHGTEASKIQFILSNDGSTDTEAFSNTTISNGTWYHVGAVYNDIDMRIYIDGSLDSYGANNPKTYSAGIVDGDTKFAIDTYFWGGASGGTYMDGLIDEVIIFDRALSAAEILDIYTNGIDGTKGGND